MSRHTVVVAICLIVAATARAQTPPDQASPATPPAEPADTTETPPPQSPETSAAAPADDRLAGDWFGLRTQLEDTGIEFNLGLTSVYQHVARDGANTHNAHDISGSYDLELGFDLEAMNLIPGGYLYVYAEGGWNDGVSDLGDVGDYFGVNGDAGGDLAILLGELWYEQTLLDGAVRIRFGRMDMSVDFETNAYANDETAQFLNNALINAGNVPFPDYAIGAQFIVTPCEWAYFGAGIADAQAVGTQTGLNTAFHGSDDFFSIFEVGLTPVFETAWGELPGGYRLGLWYDPQPKEQFVSDLGGHRRTIPTRTGDTGFYLSLDQMIFQEDPQAVTDTQGLGVFARYSYAHDDVNEIESYWSVGAEYQGLIPTRDDDTLGIGVAQGLFSEDLRFTGIRPQRETVYELYYAAQVTPWLSITPDLQWIVDPSGEGVRDAFVAGLRFQFTF